MATVPFVVGRKAGEGVGLVLRHEQVSTRHLRIEFSNGHFQVRDLGSSNGTRVDGVAVVGDFPRPLGQDSILDVGPLHCLFTCLYDDQGRIADPEDFDQAAKALLEEGLIDEPGLERARELLSETDGNRHLGEMLLSHQGTRLTINRWLNALALVRGRSGGAIPASRWRWRSILDAAYGWFNRGRAQG